MLSEDFDKKIREAAQHHHPSYDERAWAGMKKQLDKHMPVEDDRKRRGLFFLLLFLLLGGGAAIYQWGPFTRKEKPAPSSVLANTQTPADAKPSHTNNQSASVLSPNSESTGLNGNVTATNDENPYNKDRAFTKQESGLPVADKQLQLVADRQKQENKHPSIVTKASFKKHHPENDKPNLTQQSNHLQSGKPVIDKLAKTPDTNPLINPPVPPADGKRSGTVITDNKPASATVEVKPMNSNQPDRQTDKKNTDPAPSAAIAKATPPANEKGAKPKKLSRQKSNFFFAVSTGPDISFTSGDELGKMKMVSGFGLGYTFRGRITLRTGFYAGKKVYTASPANYKGSPQFYQYYPNLQKIDADCQVQEIPLNLSYHFGNKNNRPFFVSAGVSSLIMKEETYNYFYKYNASGPVMSRSHSTYNQNRHIFSQLNLSAGYQLPVGKRFTVIAEPYLKLPMGGVGIGKVRLNSTGIIFTITANPFGKLSSVKSK